MYATSAFRIGIDMYRQNLELCFIWNSSLLRRRIWQMGVGSLLWIL